LAVVTRSGLCVRLDYHRASPQFARSRSGVGDGGGASHAGSLGSIGVQIAGHAVVLPVHDLHDSRFSPRCRFLTHFLAYAPNSRWFPRRSRTLGPRSSALARNDHTLLAKSDPAPRICEWRFAGRKRRACHWANHMRTGLAQHSRGCSFASAPRMSSHKLSTLRASGADDGTANRTPSAWMISRAFLSIPSPSAERSRDLARGFAAGS